MFKSGVLTAFATASIVTLGGMTATVTPAEAGWRRGYHHAPAYRYGAPRGYRHGYYRGHQGRNIGLGLVAGVLAVGAIAAANSPAYAAPAYAAPAYGYQPSYAYAQPVYYAPRCHVRHRTVWHPHYGYVSQPVRVCR